MSTCIMMSSMLLLLFEMLQSSQSIQKEIKCAQVLFVFVSNLQSLREVLIWFSGSALDSIFPIFHLKFTQSSACLRTSEIVHIFVNPWIMHLGSRGVGERITPETEGGTEDQCVLHKQHVWAWEVLKKLLLGLTAQSHFCVCVCVCVRVEAFVSLIASLGALRWCWLRVIECLEL